MEEIFAMKTARSVANGTYSYFDHDADVGVIGRGILIRKRSMRGVAEEAPSAYKDVDLVAEATERAGLARRVAFLRPKVCVKG